MGSLFRINNNVPATFAQRQLSTSNDSLNEANQRLSSGKRINSAADDAAGLAISEGLRSQLRGLNQAERNAQDGISVLQTAEGGFDSINGKLQRMRELSVQAANDSLTSEDRKLIQEEVDQLVEEVDRTASAVEFNGKPLIGDQTDRSSLTFHVGANKDEVISLTTDDIGTGTSAALDVGNIDVTSRSKAESAIGTLDTAITSVSTNRANIGAVQNRLEGTVDFLQVQQENFQASESRIRDADIANESVKRTRANILTQAGTSVLSQAQQSPQLALQLL